MGIIDAARRLKEKITGKLTRQKAQEGQQDAKTDISSTETEKGQEGAENEASGAYASERWNEKKKAIIGVDMAAGHDQTGCANFGESAGEALKKAMVVGKGTEVDEWMRQQQAILEIIAEQSKISISEATEKWETCKQAMIKATQALAGTIRTIQEVEMLINPMEYAQLDKWQLEKLKMPNNERRRKGIPMVRRRQFIKAAKNARRRRKNRK